MAGILSIGPSALYRCDDEVFEELVKVAQRRRKEQLWSLEMQAVTAELLHALWRITAIAHSKRGAQKPKPLRIPRPWDDERQERRSRTVTLGQLARSLGRRG